MTFTPFAYFYDRYVKTSGNRNTVKMSQIKYFIYDEDQNFNSDCTQNVKFLVELDQEKSNIYWSLDTGQSEYAWSQYYFNMNHRHYQDELYQLLDSDEIKA